MVELVERMLELKRRGGARPALGGRRGGLRPPASRKQTGGQRPPLPDGGEDTGATDLDREIASTDAAIDDLVYELYGITDAERRIIEAR